MCKIQTLTIGFLHFENQSPMRPVKSISLANKKKKLLISDHSTRREGFFL